MTMGISRDDAGAFIHAYQEKGILDAAIELTRATFIGELAYRTLKDWQQACSPRYYGPAGVEDSRAREPGSQRIAGRQFSREPITIHSAGNTSRADITDRPGSIAKRRPADRPLA